MSQLKTKIIFFLLAFGVAFLMIHAILRLQVARQTNIYVQEINSIHTKIENRFKLFIDAPLAVGITSASYMASHYQNPGEYERLARNVVSVFDELLGLTILDANGKIVRVYPLKDNPDTLGKISQNFNSIKASYQKNELYWLSPPFTLYQGPRGFTFYVPMIEDGVLKGWVAPIISVDRFFNKFIRLEFLETFHLIIEDIQTSEKYFATSDLPDKDVNLHIHYAQIRGREMRFLSWRKEKSFSDHAHWPFSAFLALVLALIATYTLWLFEQKSLARRQLEDINTLLIITSRDTASALDGIQHQLGLMKQGTVPVTLEKITEHVSNITTMIQQITVLQRIALPDVLASLQKTDLNPLIKDVADNYGHLLKARNLTLQLPENQGPIEVLCNKWLICHSVLGNILVYAINNSPEGSTIKITLAPLQVIFTFEGEVAPEVLNSYLEHGLYVARQVMTIHQGTLSFEPNSIAVNFKI